MANMAPALTEAATQARAKLSNNRGGHHSNPSLVARRAVTPTSLEGAISINSAATEGQTLEPSQLVSFPKELLTAGVIGSEVGSKPRSQYIRLDTLKELASGVRKVSTSDQQQPVRMNSPNPETTTSSTKQTTRASTPTSTVVNGIGLGNHVTDQVPPNTVNSTRPVNTNAPTSTMSKPSVSLSSKETSQVSENTTGAPISVPSAGSNVKVRFMTNTEVKPDVSKRQRDMERRAERMLRRLRRLQSRQAVVHIKQQLSGVVDHQHKNLQTMAKSMKSPNPSASVDLKTELLQSEDVKSLSTAALVTLVRKLQSSQALSLRQRLAHQQATNEGGSSVLRLDEDLCMEMNRVAGTLQMNLHHLESALDSDATESSSGGESCDEDFDFDYEKPPRSSL